MRSQVVRWVRRIGIGLVGGVVSLAGLAMIVLPGPGLLTLILGLVILRVEFAIADVWLQRTRLQLARVTDRLRGRRNRP